MSKILVVEPNKMLQQAIAMSLFPDHDVHFSEALPSFGAVAVEDFDVVVLDVAALRDQNSLTADTVRAVQDWQVPMIWLESGDATNAPSREKLVVLQRPIAKDSLLAALAECLGPQSQTKPNGKADAAGKDSKHISKVSAPERKTEAAAGVDQPSIIELVEIVEDGAASRKGKRQPSNK